MRGESDDSPILYWDYNNGVKRVLCLLLVLWGLAEVKALDSWEWLNPRPTSHSMRAVTANESLYVAVGHSGAILHSQDLTNWTHCSTDIPAVLLGVAYGNGRFVATGFKPDPSTAYFLTSPDGTNWTKIKETRSVAVQVAFGNGRFVVAGSEIWTSRDGISWVTNPFPGRMGSYCNSIKFSNGKFFASLYDGQVYSSPDGANWSAQINFQGIPTACVSGRDGLIIAVGNGGIATLDAAGRPGSQPSTNNAFYFDITYASGRFVAVGKYLDNGLVGMSEDGTNWINRELEGVSGLTSVIYSKGQFVAVGQAGQVVVSSDGLQWVELSSGPRVSVAAAAQSGSNFVAVGSALDAAPTSNAMYSQDGSNWRIIDTGIAKNLNGIATDSRSWVAVGSDGTILYSENGIDWRQVDSGTSNQLYHVSYGNGVFVAGGKPGTILTSTDGIHWESQRSIYGGSYYFGSFAGGLFFNSGVETILQVSSNGRDWSYATNMEASIVVFGNGKYVARAHRGNANISTDGYNWRPFRSDIIPLAFYGGRFVGTSTNLDDAGVLFSSRDLTNWTRHAKSPSLGLLKNLGGSWYQFGAYGGVVRASWKSPAELNLVIKNRAACIQVETFSPNARYVLQSATGFQGTWEPLHEFEFSPDILEYTDQHIDPQMRFYRVVSR